MLISYLKIKILRKKNPHKNLDNVLPVKLDNSNRQIILLSLSNLLFPQ